MMQISPPMRSQSGSLLAWAAATAFATLAAVAPAAAEAPAVDMTTVSSIDAKAPAAGVIGSPEGKRIRYRAHRTPLRDDSLSISVISPDTGEETKVELPDLDGISFNMVCRGEDGSRSACGSRARVQLFNFLSRQDVACLFAAVGEASRLVSCEVQGQDLGAWLVRHGVARPKDLKAHAEAQREAHKARAGMWADAQTRKSLLVASSN